MTLAALAAAGTANVSAGINGSLDGAASGALSTPIAIGAGWSETTTVPPAFFFGGVGPATDGPFTFVAGGPVVVSVTDAFQPGDSFELFDFGGSIGTTPAVASGGFITGDPNLAFGDAAFSYGSFPLGAGAHSISIDLLASPHGSGRAYIRVDRAVGTVPDSGSSALLLGLGVAGIGALARRKQ